MQLIQINGDCIKSTVRKIKQNQNEIRVHYLIALNVLSVSRYNTLVLRPPAVMGRAAITDN